MEDEYDSEFDESESNGPVCEICERVIHLTNEDYEVCRICDQICCTNCFINNNW